MQKNALSILLFGLLLTAKVFSQPVFPQLPLIGDSVVCGSNPVVYTCTWNSGGGTQSCYTHTVQVSGGTIVAQTETSLGINFWDEEVWVSWGSGPTGTLTSYYAFCDGSAGSIWTENIVINCGFSGPRFVCVNAPQIFSQNCPNGSTYFWSTTHGTMLSGQSTDSVEIVWNTPGVDTVVTIFNSVSCGLDTNYFPVTILGYPTNQIMGVTWGCENMVDTFGPPHYPC